MLFLQYHFLIGLQMCILTPQLHILGQDLAVLLRQHVNGSLQLREHVVVMFPTAYKPCEHTA